MGSRAGHYLPERLQCRLYEICSFSANGAQFEMAIRNDTTKSGAPLHLFQAQTPYETYLGGLNAQELANLKDLTNQTGQILRFKSG